MAAKPLTSEAIALTEKKMDMTLGELSAFAFSMDLDDIIKMSKNTSNKSKKLPRIPNKIQRPVSNAAKDKALKVRQYMDSRASVRQGVLAQRRSNFQGNRFPFVAEAARRAAVAPFRNRAFNSRRGWSNNCPKEGCKWRFYCKGTHFSPEVHMIGHRQPQQQQQQQLQQDQQVNIVTKQRPKTLDSLFANMKEERLRVLSHQNNGVQPNGRGRQRMPWGRGRFGN
ncbi:hypothetical protein Gogos_013597 [Gossypium gossypioides]|uniref:Uncharacterized protein n=1 Tax=Gossypium gossypioides TaxID=34282 RepID=A0A7J9BWC3_GOSGO|nr:hypothetical protein [Gossypium gossypioides]